MTELVLFRKDKKVGELKNPLFSGASFDIEKTVAPFICKIMNSENLQLSSSPSQFPVETGYNVSDNIVNTPKTLTIQGLITTESLSQSILTVGGLFGNGLGGATSVIWSKITGKTNLAKLAATGFGKRQNADEARDMLQEMWDSREIVDVLTSVYDIKNMAIVSLTFPRSAANSHKSLIFNMTLKEIRVAKVTKGGTVAITQKRLPRVADSASDLAQKGAATNDTILKTIVVKGKEVTAENVVEAGGG